MPVPTRTRNNHLRRASTLARVAAAHAMGATDCIESDSAVRLVSSYAAKAGESYAAALDSYDAAEEARS